MFNGSLIEDLFAVVRKAEKSALPALPEQTPASESIAKPLATLNHHRETNSETE